MYRRLYMSPSENSGKKLKFLRALSNLKQIKAFSHSKWRSTGKFKGFFILEQRNIYTWLYVPVTGHITIWHILGKNKSMRSEPQNIRPEFDVLTPKLSCLIRFSHLIFETNVVERGHSGQISLVVTCTAVCTCHHLKFPAKSWNFGKNRWTCAYWSESNKLTGESIGGPQTMMPDTLFARPNNQHNHVRHWSLETCIFGSYLSVFFHSYSTDYGAK